MAVRPVLLSAVALLALAGAAAGPAASATGSPSGSAPPAGTALVAGSPIDVESAMSVDCDSAQLLGPEATSTAHVVGAAPEVDLDVLVLADLAEGAAVAQIADDAERAAAEQALLEEVREKLEVGIGSYAPLEVDLRLDRFALLQPLVDGAPRVRTTDAQEIIELAKAQYGGERPEGTDVVYVVTDLDLTLPGLGNAVAGLADCIGGVALPDRAFAVGETGVLVDDEGGIPIGPVAFYRDFTAKVFAHEVGHLMGGHHHYQECGTPVLVAVGRGEAGPCSLMTNAVDFQTTPFSTVNGIVVRGHAERFASANDPR